MKNIDTQNGTEKYVSYSGETHYLYAFYDNAEDAMPVKVIPTQEGGFEFVMQSYHGDQENKFISFTDDGNWLREHYDNQSDAMTFVLEQVKI